jgi:hypothetical protein
MSDATPNGTGVHKSPRLGVAAVFCDSVGLVYRFAEGGFLTVAPGPGLSGVTFSMGTSPAQGGYVPGVVTQNVTKAEAEQLLTVLTDVLDAVS